MLLAHSKVHIRATNKTVFMITYSFLNQSLWCNPHWNRLSETIPMSGHTIGFGWEIRKLAFWQLSILDLICCPGRLLKNISILSGLLQWIPRDRVVTMAAHILKELFAEMEIDSWITMEISHRDTISFDHCMSPLIQMPYIP